MFLEFRVQVLCVSMLQFLFFSFAIVHIQKSKLLQSGGHSREVWVEVRSVEDKNPLFR